MRVYVRFTSLLLLAALWGCSSTVVVPVPPRMELARYATLGVVEFDSNADPAINAQATRQFQEQIHAAQPGTRLIALGHRGTVLAAIGAAQLDANALQRIGQKYGVDAIFFGEIVYSDPRTDVTITDINRLAGRVSTEIKGDISSQLMETRTGASVWSSSAWAKRQIGRVSVSTDYGVNAKMNNADPRVEMLPALVFHLTEDFRPSTVRRRVD